MVGKTEYKYLFALPETVAKCDAYPLVIRKVIGSNLSPTPR